MRWLPIVAAFFGCGRLGFDATGGGSPNPDAVDGDGNPIDPTGDGSLPDGTQQTTFVVQYTTLPNGNAPSARRSSGAVSAPDGRIWIYGGFNAGGPQAEIFVYSPTAGTWTAPATTPPPARERHAIAFDPVNDRLVSFGGYSGTFPLFVHHDELYVFAPATSTWTQIPKAGTWPAPRKDSVLLWMPTQNKLLLYGGNNGSGSTNRFSDIYTLTIDVNTNTATWTLLSPGGDPPPKNSAPCAAYDPIGKRYIMYGGEPTDGNDANTTYQYLVATNVWQLDATTGMSPGGRSFSNCAWDPVANRVAFYGGQSSGAPTNGAYSYDPTAKQWDFLALASGTTAPGNLSDAGATYSPVLGGMFIFGGRSATTTYSNQSLLVDLK